MMYSPPPDEAAEALARDPIDPVEATERFLEDAAAVPMEKVRIGMSREVEVRIPAAIRRDCSCRPPLRRAMAQNSRLVPLTR